MSIAGVICFIHGRKVGFFSFRLGFLFFLGFFLLRGGV